jgi:hypothetical protein
MLPNRQRLRAQHGAQRRGATRALPAAMLSRSNLSRTPKPSLNADVPHAGLRRSSGPPVGLYR